MGRPEAEANVTTSNRPPAADIGNAGTFTDGEHDGGDLTAGHLVRLL